MDSLGDHLKWGTIRHKSDYYCFCVENGTLNPDGTDLEGKEGGILCCGPARCPTCHKVVRETDPRF
jgi:hypothetical protein